MRYAIVVATCVLAIPMMSVSAANLNLSGSVGGTGITLKWNSINDPDQDLWILTRNSAHDIYLPISHLSYVDPYVLAVGDSVTYTIQAIDRDVRGPGNAWHRIATDSWSKSIQSELQRTINTAPTANAGSDFTIREGQNITLNGKRSSDPQRDHITFEWRTDSADIFIGNFRSSEPYVQTHDLFEKVNGTITLTVSDGELTDTDEVFFEAIPNHSPTVHFVWPTDSILKTKPGDTLILTIDGSDPDNNLLIFWFEDCPYYSGSFLPQKSYGKVLATTTPNTEKSILLCAYVSDGLETHYTSLYIANYHYHSD